MAPGSLAPLTVVTLQTRNEISDQERNIGDMEAAVKAKENPLKLAETR